MKALFLALAFFMGSMAQAMSTRIECSAYAVGDLKLGIQKLEIKADKEGKLVLLLNNVKAKVIASSYECRGDLECNILNGYSIALIEPFKKTAMTLNLHKGAVKLQYSEPMRGGTYEESVYEINPIATSGEDTLKLTGVCSTNL